MKQIERIMHMERILDEAEAAVKDLRKAIERCRQMQSAVRELECYYTGPAWKRDYLDDCEGRLPENLKRGVLSEDAVYNLLTLWNDLPDEIM